MAKEYTYYHFVDDLCGEDEFDLYRMGPDGLEFCVGDEWSPSSFADMEDLKLESLNFGHAHYWEVKNGG